MTNLTYNKLFYKVNTIKGRNVDKKVCVEKIYNAT